MTVVKNRGQSIPKKNWVNYLQNKFGKVVNRCDASGCSDRQNLSPVLVQKNTNANSWYIITLCEIHGKTQGELKICNTTRFIPENEFEYWEKTEVQGLR